MGKKQHQKDKLYLTSKEWNQFYGGKKRTHDGKIISFRRLPFDHCALSLQPFEYPVIAPGGHVYELTNIIPFLKKYGIDPVTGKKLDKSLLIKLNFTKNSDGCYHCPVLYKVFTENSHIVAIKTTGNVFSFEAVEELNLKPKNFTDLLNGESFTRKDILTIQDPTDLEKFNFNEFHHLKSNIKINLDESEDGSSGISNLKYVNSITRDVLEELKKEDKEDDKSGVSSEGDPKQKLDKFNAAHYSTGAVAASSTSTAVDLSTEIQAAVLDADIVRYSRVKKKGYVRIETNYGLLNLELHCDIVPKACENFIKLSQKGYYNGTIFHRSIRNFMIQGGDPTGTGKGGESYWGAPFKDEFRPELHHKGRGVLSMANSGKHTNKSQFFITYRSCQHLDWKHTIFGRVVGGLDTLNIIEKIEADAEDKPKEEIKILKVTVFVDPYQEADEQLAKEREEEEKEKKAQLSKSDRNPVTKQLKPYSNGVGKYINMDTSSLEKEEALPSNPVKKKHKSISSSFGDFSTW